MSTTTISSFTLSRKPMIAVMAFTVCGTIFAGLASAQSQVSSLGGVTVITVQNPGAAGDLSNYKPMALPDNPIPSDATQALLQAAMSAAPKGPSGFSAGFIGSGVMNPSSVGLPGAADSGVSSQDFGTNKHPFSTSRADLYTAATNTQYPYRAAGNLTFNIGNAGYICSASLIKRGIAVTAAHCVANFGHSQFYTNWNFRPGYRSAVAPYGTWSVKQAWILTAYYNGTDSCAVAGIVCTDDVALLILNTQSGAYPGTATGWYGYGYGGYGYVNNITQITQLGYPAGLDSASLMERDDSYGYVSSGNSNNTIIGSNMNGGSSGGPWLVNFGIAPTLTGETSGSAPGMDVIVGVTSWGYTSNTPKEQGAAPFLSTNIQVLITAACAATPAACL